MLLRCALLLCILAVPVVGQQTHGTVKGTVTDQLESLVVGATVTLRNANGVVVSTTTNSALRVLRTQ